MPFVRGAAIRVYGSEILDALRKAPREDDSCVDCEDAHGYNPKYKEKVNKLTERILNLVKKRAEENQIDPILLASKHQVVKYINLRMHNAPATEAKIATGWRAKILQPTLGKIL